MANYKNLTESGLIKSGAGEVHGVIVNSHTSGTLALNDGTGSSTPAVGTITQSVGAATPASHAGSEIVSSGVAVPATHAVSVFTSTGVVVDGQTITIGTRVYRAKVTPVQAYDIDMTGTAAQFLANLKAAINGTATSQQAYGGTLKNTQVVATTLTATALTVRGRVPGTSLNAVATTETFTNGNWADTTLGGGTGASDAGVNTTGATITIGGTIYTFVNELSEALGAVAIPYQVVAGANAAVALDNLKSAINGTVGVGSTYSTGTIAHASVVATTNTDTVQTIRGRVLGDSLDTLPTTTTFANFAFADTTLGGGTGNSNPGVSTATATITIGNRVYTAVLELSETLGITAVPDQVLWVTDEATFLDNLKSAINASASAGVQYSAGTVAHTQVKATTNSATAQVLEAIVGGTAGNAIATTASLTNYAFAGATLASGAGVASKKMISTMTLVAGPQIIDFPASLTFSNGLAAVYGGTLDATFVFN